MKHCWLKQRKTVNTQKRPEKTARNQHFIYNVVAVTQSFAMRKLHEAEVLFIHRKVGIRYGLNLWTEKVVCFYWHRKLHKAFRFHTGWTLPTPQQSCRWCTRHCKSIRKETLVKERQGTVLWGKGHRAPLCSVCVCEQMEWDWHIWYSNLLEWLNRKKIKF